MSVTSPGILGPSSRLRIKGTQSKLTAEWSVFSFKDSFQCCHDVTVALLWHTESFNIVFRISVSHWKTSAKQSLNRRCLEPFRQDACQTSISLEKIAEKAALIWVMFTCIGYPEKLLKKLTCICAWGICSIVDSCIILVPSAVVRICYIHCWYRNNKKCDKKHQKRQKITEGEPHFNKKYPVILSVLCAALYKYTKVHFYVLSISKYWPS